MQDPHVKALYYRVVHSDTVDYARASPLEYETDVFKVRLENGKAVFEMKEHHTAVESARAVVDDFIKAWEIDAGLKYGPDKFCLRFERAEIVDRNPKPNSAYLHVHGTLHTVISDNVTLHVSEVKYPAPLGQFSVSPDVEVMFTRYIGYKHGRELLASMANFCLTVVEAPFKNQKTTRRATANYYSIDSGILQTLGKLLANKGGPEEARKAPVGKAYESFMPSERAWIEEAVKMLIRRVGERAASPNANLSLITMADLPSLKN